MSLPASSELVTSRFVQESLTNVAKYSQAANVWVELIKNDSSIDILVRDDGVGFDTEKTLAGQLGLAGTRYRTDSLGGTMQVTSQPGGGTTVTANIPKSKISQANISHSNTPQASLLGGLLAMQ